jgi:carotenoid cleavage dioxygenase
MKGQPPYAWELEKGAYVGVMKPRLICRHVWFRGGATSSRS